MTPFSRLRKRAHPTLSRRGVRTACCLWLTLLLGEPTLGLTLELREELADSYEPAFTYFVDEPANATLAQIKDLPERAFRPSEPHGVTLGFTTGAVWLRFDAVNLSNPDTVWLLHVSDPLLDDVRVYQQLPGGEIRESRLGDQSPQPPEAVDALNPVLPVTLPPNQPTRFYLRIQSKSSMLINVQLMTARRFFKDSVANSLGYGAMFGIVAAMCLYNLFLYASLRDPNYLLYVVSMSSTALFLACLSGYAPRWLWPEHQAWSEEIFQYVVAVMLVSGLWFCTRFLEAKHYAPRLHSIILLLIGLSVLTVPLSYLTGFQLSVHLTGAVSAAAGTAGLVTAAVCLVRGQRSARYYLTAWPSTASAPSSPPHASTATWETAISTYTGWSSAPFWRRF